MTLGELKISCYKLINPAEQNIDASKIIQYENDTNMGYYFINMLASINGAITRIVQENILPIKRIEIDCSTFIDAENNVIVISLDEFIEDLYKVKLIEYRNPYGKAQSIEYRLLGKYLEIKTQKEGSYVVYYHPKINLLETYQTEDLEDINLLELSDLGISDNIASIIPLYVKGDILEHDKPSEAIIAKNTFDQYVQSFEQEELDMSKKETKSWWSKLL